MRSRSLLLSLLSSWAIVVCAACSSSSTSTKGTGAKDAGADTHTTKQGDAGHDSGVADTGSAMADTGSKPDTSTGTPDARPAHDAAPKDTGVVSPFDAFVYPEAAIPHDAGSDAPVSKCAGLPDESSYCAPAVGGSSTGFYVCMQGNSIYSPCSPGTTCVATDGGAIGIACEAP